MGSPFVCTITRREDGKLIFLNLRIAEDMARALRHLGTTWQATRWPAPSHQTAERLRKVGFRHHTGRLEDADRAWVADHLRALEVARG